MVSAPRVLVVSDSHLSPRAAEAGRNWSAIVRHVDDVRPDLVVHVGDLSLDGQHDSDDLLHARHELDRFGAPWVAVPGNHDIGDNPVAGAGPDQVVTGDRRSRWLQHVGDDYWAVELGGWRLLGLDAQLFGTGLDAEAEQWDFLHRELDRSTRSILISHKPVTATAPELATAPPYRFVPAPGRDRLADRLDGGGVEVVVSGHVHQYRSFRHGSQTHVWAPTSWAVLPEAMQASIGAKRCGILALELPDGAEAEPVVEFVEPDGLAQLTLAENAVDPYATAGTV
jgi:3',5'-cyclic AMP phosphodiesterase CpdA